MKDRQYIASPVTGRKERSNCLLAGSGSQAGGSIKALAEAPPPHPHSPAFSSDYMHQHKGGTG